MAGRIPSEFIDELLTRVDIVDVIQARVALKRQGREYVARCPFHDERSPSFTVSPEKQFFHCFGCGAHGSAIGFLMDFENLDFVEAVETLARQEGLELPRHGGEPEANPASGERAALAELLEAVSRYYQQQRRRSPEARAYTQRRGLSEATLDRFGIGFAPPGWSGVLDAFRRHPLGIEGLDAAGLLATSQSSGRRFDRFRNRLMFPIRDRRGRIVGFGGRALGDDTPKYLNSPETALFRKRQELYGLYEARQSGARLERVIVVEGYMDVVSLAQHGLTNAVAALGTALAQEQADRLLRTAPEVIVCFDGDPAGREAAWRALDAILPVIRDDRTVRFWFLPEHDDPDSLVNRVGPAGFENALAGDHTLAQFTLGELTRRHDPNTPEGRAQLARAGMRQIRSIRAPYLKEQLQTQLAASVNSTPERLSQMGLSQSDEATEAPRRETLKQTPMRTAIGLVLLEPGVARTTTPDDLQGLSLAGIELLRKLLETVHQNPHITAGRLWESWRQAPEASILQRLSGAPWLEQAIDSPETAAHLFQDALRRIQDQDAEQRVTQLLQKARETRLSPDDKAELQRLLAARHDPSARDD
jgi:DNA primase